MANWSVSSTSPSSGSVTIDQSTGKITFPKNTGSTNISYTISYTSDTNCTASTTYTISKSDICIDDAEIIVDYVLTSDNRKVSEFTITIQNTLNPLLKPNCDTLKANKQISIYSFYEDYGNYRFADVTNRVLYLPSTVNATVCNDGVLKVGGELDYDQLTGSGEMSRDMSNITLYVLYGDGTQTASYNQSTQRVSVDNYCAYTSFSLNGKSNRDSFKVTGNLEPLIDSISNWMTDVGGGSVGDASVSLDGTFSANLYGFVIFEEEREFTLNIDRCFRTCIENECGEGDDFCDFKITQLGQLNDAAKNSTTINDFLYNILAIKENTYNENEVNITVYMYPILSGSFGYTLRDTSFTQYYIEQCCEDSNSIYTQWFKTNKPFTVNLRFNPISHTLENTITFNIFEKYSNLFPYSTPTNIIDENYTRSVQIEGNDNLGGCVKHGYFNRTTKTFNTDFKVYCS